MASRLWAWSRHGKWVGFGRIDGGLLPGVKLGFGTLSWCPGHWEDDVADAFIKKANQKKEERK